MIVHDLESKCPLEVLQHPRAVCSLSIDPFNEQVVTTAGNDGRLLLFDTRQSVHGKALYFFYILIGIHYLCILSTHSAHRAHNKWISVDLKSPIYAN